MRFFWIVVLLLTALILAVWTSGSLKGDTGAQSWTVPDQAWETAGDPLGSLESGPVATSAGGSGGGPADEEAVVIDSVQPERVETTAPAVREMEPTGQEEADYFIHVASFRDSTRSEVYAGMLDRRSLPTRVIKETVDDQQWYRVYIGPEPTREVARVMANNLLDTHQIEYYRIVKLPKDPGAEPNEQRRV